MKLLWWGDVDSFVPVSQFDILLLLVRLLTLDLDRSMPFRRSSRISRSARPTTRTPIDTPTAIATLFVDEPEDDVEVDPFPVGAADLYG